MNKKTTGPLMSMVIAMLIFGTIGIFVKFIPMPSSLIALCRGVGGGLFLVLVMFFRHQKLDVRAIRNNLICLLLSGGFLGFNWILLFEAYRYTTVATATLCYYMAPVMVMLGSPVLFGEKLTRKGILCGLAALVGMVFVSGVVPGGIPAAGEAKGILFGLAAAVLYASIVVLNKKIQNISPWDKTVLQLLISAVVVLPYVLLTVDFDTIAVTPLGVGMLLLVAILHTGVAYALYFGSIGQIPGQTVAMYSYLDPVLAILLSALVLRESLTVFGGLGAVLVLGSALVNEIKS